MIGLKEKREIKVNLQVGVTDFFASKSCYSRSVINNSCLEDNREHAGLEKKFNFGQKVTHQANMGIMK